MCVKIGGLAGQETQQVCVRMTDDLKSGKISVTDWVKKVGDELKTKNVSPLELEKAFSAAITELKRPAEPNQALPGDAQTQHA